MCSPWVPLLGFLGGSDRKEPACNAGDLGLIPGSGSSPREGNVNPLQYSCLENPKLRGAWQATEHGVTKSQTRLEHMRAGASTCGSQEASQRGRKQLERILGTQTLATVTLGVFFLPCGYWRWQVPFWTPLPSLLALGSTSNPHQPVGTSTRMPPAKQLARWRYSPAHQQTCCLTTPEPTAAPDLAL